MNKNNTSFIILIVDDEEAIVKSLTRLLEKYYTIVSAVNGARALEILNSNIDVGMIISDQRMPEMSGVDLLKKSLVIKPDAIRIILSGQADLNDIITSINEAKIYKFLMKPIDPSSFLLQIKRAVEAYEKDSKNLFAIKELTEKNELLERKIKQANIEGRDYFLSYEELRETLISTPLHYYDAISHQLMEIKDDDDFLRYKSRLLRLSMDGKKYLKYVNDLSLEKGFSNEYWKLDDIALETSAILIEWKKHKYIKINVSISPDIKVFGNKTLLRDLIFCNATIYFADNLREGDTISITADFFDDENCTILISNSRSLNKEKISELAQSKSPLNDSSYRDQNLIFLEKILKKMKGRILFSKANARDSAFIAITLQGTR